MKQALRRWIAHTLQRLAQSPRIRSLAKRLLERTPGLRRVAMRLMHNGPLFERHASANRFEPLSEYQQRLIRDLQKRWGE